MKPSVALALAVAVPLSLAAVTSATAAEPESAVIVKRHVDRDAVGDVYNPLGEFDQRVVTLFASGGKECKFVNATNPKTHNDLWVRKPGGEWGKFKDSDMYGLRWVSSTESGQMKVNLATRHFKSGQIENVRTRAVVRHEGKKATDRVDPTSAWILKF